MKTSGTSEPGSQQPITVAPESKPPIAGANAAGQAVHAVEPAINLSRGPSLKGVALQNRRVEFSVVKEGWLVRLKSWVKRKPTPWEENRINDLASSLIQQLKVSSPGQQLEASIWTAHGFKASLDTYEYKTGILLVNAGLAELRQNQYGEQVFTYKRPYALQAQVRKAEQNFQSLRASFLEVASTPEKSILQSPPAMDWDILFENLTNMGLTETPVTMQKLQEIDKELKHRHPLTLERIAWQAKIRATRQGLEKKHFSELKIRTGNTLGYRNLDKALTRVGLTSEQLKKARKNPTELLRTLEREDPESSVTEKYRLHRELEILLGNFKGQYPDMGVKADHLAVRWLHENDDASIVSLTLEEWDEAFRELQANENLIAKRGYLYSPGDRVVFYPP